MKRALVVPWIHPAKLLLWILLVSLVAAAPLCAQKVKVEANPEADFTALKTYAWKRGAPAPNPGTDEFIRTHIEKQMAAKGFRAAAEGEADFLLTYYAGLDVDVNSSTYEYAWPVWGGGLVATGAGDAWTEGRLTVDMVDRTGTRLLWRGQTKTLLQGYGSETVKRVEKAIEKLFQKFPPPKK